MNFVNTPYISSRKQKRLWSDVWEAIDSDFEILSDSAEIGSIEYEDGNACKLLVKSASEANYRPTYSGQQEVRGLHIPSHRPTVSYKAIESIPTNPKTSTQQFQEYQTLLQQAYGTDRVNNPGVILKQSLISLSVFGYGNQVVAANDQFRELFEGFQDVLRKLLPSQLGFLRLEIRTPEIVLVTKAGAFSLDAMSGGIGAVFGMAWQIHMFGAESDAPCTVLIDEPENHLHPSMQREFLPSLERAFPNYRFIISTHSPFVVTSSPNALVHALVYGDDSRIVSKTLDEASLSSSPNRILREVLDVPTTIPLWVEERITQVIQKHGGESMSSENASAAYEELKRMGIVELGG